MSADLIYIRAALADRYDVIDLLGEGGMATVYRATDRRHNRQVAIKILRPDLSLAIGAERFVREIEIAAQLQHPHILPLFHSGEAGGMLYYVMPLVEGESLRGRLAREKQLPIADAIRITREVGRALAYAHERGFVHRDIKPENILLSGGQAVVADFGIAKALKVAGGERLTLTGTGIGTPGYMSPEQATGASDADPRSDIYSLGCLLYEMVAGQPPYTGPTVESVVIQHIGAPVPRVTVIRATVGPVVEQAIARALAKAPADRFQTTSAFLDALDENAPPPTTTGARFELGSLIGTRWRPRRILAGLAVAVAALAIGNYVVSQSRRPTVDPTVITVLPFRVSATSSLSFLREGMVDLLTTQIGSMVGVRALDARTVLAAWRRTVPEGADPSVAQERRIAAELGSGRLVSGSIVDIDGGLEISARLVDVIGGDPIEASVRGSRDSLFALVDGLTAQLAAGIVREPARRLAELTSVSLPAVRAYLEGRAALRRGERARSAAQFTEALELDSTFALAALGMASSGIWSQQSGQSTALRRGLRTGYALRERLSKRDRLLFEAYVLPNTGGAHSAAEQLRGWQRAAEAAPESPEAQYEYADRLYHSGDQLGIADALVRAEAAFTKAYTLDSSYVPALTHLVEIAARSGDRGLGVQRANQIRSATGIGDAGEYVAWRVALALNDRPGLSEFRSRFAAMRQSSLNRIVGFGLADGVLLTDVDAAAAELRRRAQAGALEPQNVHPGQTLLSWANNRGRRRDAEQAVKSLSTLDTLPAGSSIVFFSADQALVLGALFWDGDTLVASAAAARLAQRTAAALPTERDARARAYTDLCVEALWRLRDPRANVDRAIRQLSAGTVASDSAAVRGVDPALCRALLETARAATASPPDMRAHLVRLDSMLATGPYVFGADWGSLVVARYWEASGDLPAALRAIRRRAYDWDTGPLYLSTYLREEGRLSLLTGGTTRAITALERFVALRSGADALYRAETDSLVRVLGTLKRGA